MLLLSFMLGSIKIVLFGRDLISSLNTVQLLAPSIAREEFPACVAGGAMALGMAPYPVVQPHLEALVALWGLCLRKAQWGK